MTVCNLFNWRRVRAPCGKRGFLHRISHFYNASCPIRIQKGLAGSVVMVLPASSFLLSEEPIKAGLRLGKLAWCYQYNSIDIVCALDTPSRSYRRILNGWKILEFNWFPLACAEMLSQLPLNTIREVKQWNWNDKTFLPGTFIENSVNQEGS